MKLNIRCCCEPLKILGTLNMDPSRARLGRQIVPLLAEQPNVDGPQGAPVAQAEIKLRAFGDRAELAVYSDDRPVEFWRRVPGFTEGEKIPACFAAQAEDPFHNMIRVLAAYDASRR